MAELTVAMTYGTALFEAASEREMIDQIRQEADELLEVMDKEPDLRRFLAFPNIPAGEKKTAVEEIFKGRISEELLNFLCVLIDNRRIDRLAQIIKEYRNLADHREGVIQGTVYSAVPLDEKRIEEIEEETSKLLREKVSLINEIDENLIAGFKILADGRIIDLSYRRRFDEMANQLNIS